MQWVEGLTLNQFVAQYLDRPAMLQSLLSIWALMGKRLREAEIAHGDIQHGNVLLVPGTNANSLALKLIDYDGMFVPALAARKSAEVGHAAYQHPQRAREGTYSLDVDRFPLLLVATALRALAVKGRPLWEKHDNGDNLLFREADLLSPMRSPLFADLFRSADSLTVALADHLLKSLRGGLVSAPLLTEVLPEARLTPRSSPAPRASTTPPSTAPSGAPTPLSEAPLGKLISLPAQRTQTAPLSRRAWIVAAGGGLALVLVLACVGFIYQATQDERTTVASGPPASKDRPGTLHTSADQKVPSAGLKSKPREPSKPAPAESERKGDTKDMIGASAPEDKAAWPSPSLPLPNQVTNSVGMKLALIPAGTFMMGSPEDESDHLGAMHMVKITQPFYMSAYPVTKAQFAAFITAAGDRTDAEIDKEGQGYNEAAFRYDRGPKYTWKYTGYQQTDQHPVVNVSWNDAARFCIWLSSKEGKIYRLPTEAEWEYACRAGTKSRYWCGNRDEDLKGNANIADASLRDKLDANYRSVWKFASWDDGYPFSSPVGKFNPNPWGLYDINGNVWQWCADWYGVYPTGFSSDPKGPENGDNRVLRGGSWHDDTSWCRAACRHAVSPSHRGSETGFRPVLRLPVAQPVYLAGMVHTNVSSADFSKGPWWVKKVASPNALFLHPPPDGSAFVTYDLGRRYGRFKADVGLSDTANDGAGSATALTFSVVGDDILLWSSNPVQRCGETQTCDVSVAGVKTLQLRVGCPASSEWAHAVWVEPRVEK
jgi:formylglycine-generating enzyme required for sulfatase activity